MKVMKARTSKHLFVRLLSIVVSVGLLTTAVPLAPAIYAAEADASSQVTSDLPVINEVIDESGFKHPGVGLTKELLENVRTQVREQKEPWLTYFNQMSLSSAAATSVTSSNQSSTDPTKPATDAFNSQGFNSKFIADGLKAYTQALMYVITGDEVYRANGMRIIRIWSQMDPAKYVYFSDAHIHTGIPLNRMVTAAEILRYTSTQTEELKWTDQDTANFTNNLINPVINTFEYDNSWFMNQNNYAIIGAMAGFIFTGNHEAYNQRVEWYTVNKTARNQGFNGSIERLFRWVDTNEATGEKIDNPHVQHVEMGRDQAHGGGDLTNAAIINRMLLAQGTKVDPVDGTVSTNADAVGPYEFLNDRIMAAANYFWQYMLGYDTPWTPVAYSIAPDGRIIDTYNRLAGGYRGRFNTTNFWDIYSYYTYVKGINIAEKAPYYYEAFTKKYPLNWSNVDGGEEYWLYLPKEAEADAAKFLPKQHTSADLYDAEIRYTSLDNNSATLQEGDTFFVRMNATEAGSRIALLSTGNGTKTIGVKIRTNGVAQLEMAWGINDTITLPDTKGQWRYVVYNLGTTQGLSDMQYLTVKGPSGTTVDIDHLNFAAGTQLTPPVFNSGNSELNISTYTGSTISVDLSAADANSSDVVAYESPNLPQGAVLNPDTGALSWQTTQAGTYSFTVQASDGTTITAKDIHIVVSADRASAVQESIALYNPNAIYVAASLAQYKAVYEATISQIDTASDEAFNLQLQTLRSAAESLQLATPLLKSDGSMDFSKIVVTSTFGTGISALVDNNNDSFTGFRRKPDLYHILDFGPDYKVSASAFGIQSRMNFVDRGAGSIVLGSNDMVNWTRLTPQESPFTSDLAIINVDDAYKNNQYRFIKIEMIHPQPDALTNTVQNIMELGEFRIFGERHERGNKISSVSISSAQSLKNRIVPGDTIQLSFQSTEDIQDVKAAIQGKTVTVATTDNRNWTATLVTDNTIQTGTVNFSIQYKRADGTDADPVIFTTDSSKLFIADQTGLISNILDITSLRDSSGRNATDLLTQARYLFDGNLGTSTDFRVNGSGYGGYIVFDFKQGGSVKLSKAEIIARQDQVSRINGTVVQGSNDNTNWTTISTVAGNTAEWQTLTVSGNEPYRYIRIFNGNNWFGNMAELRLYGVTESTNKIESVSIDSAQRLKNRIVAGNTVKLSFKAKEEISEVKVTIQGQEAQVQSADNINWTATATMNADAAPGNVAFGINYKMLNGEAGYPASETTDNSKLYIVDESDVIRNVSDIATLIDSTSGRTAATTKSIVNSLFDSNLGSVSDFRLNGTGSGSYITFDFKQGNQAVLTSVELIGRQESNLLSRIKYTVVQGSNDNAAWTDLTTAAAGSADWQTFAVSSKVPYRYIRVYNWSAWYGNMAELRLHGAVKAADVTAPVTTSDAPQGWVNHDTVVNLSASDENSGVAATYYTVNGGERQTGNQVTLTAEGTHTVTYWSVDNAGNAEQPHTISVKIDKTAPADAALTADTAELTNKDVTVTIAYPDDAAVKEYKIGDVGAWTSYNAPVAVAANDTVYARGTDEAGNVSNVSSYAVSNIDKTGPADAIISADITAPVNGDVTVAISYPDDAVAKEYKIGDGAWTAYADAIVVTDNVTFYARGTDALGNVSNVSSYTVSNIDRVAPADAALSADIATPTNADVTVTISYPDDAAVKEYKLGESGEWTSYGAPVVVSDNVTVFARSADAAGNVSNVTSYTVSNIDHIAPVDAILAVDTTAPTNQGVTVTISYPADAAVQAYKVGVSGEWTAYTTPLVVADNETVYARGTDAVGNVSNIASITVSNIYRIAPVTTVTLNPGAPNGKDSWYTTNVTVSLSVSASPNGGAVTTEYQVNDGEWITYTGSIPAFGDGIYKFAYRSRDQAGNVEQLKTVEFKVDATAPALNIQLDKTSIWPANHIMVPVNATVTANDAGSGIESVVLTSITSDQPDSGKGDIQAAFGTGATSFSLRAEKSRTYTITYTATDKAGNKTVATAAVTVPHDQS